jgi:hypothetical protein
MRTESIIQCRRRHTPGFTIGTEGLGSGVSSRSHPSSQRGSSRCRPGCRKSCETRPKTAADGLKTILDLLPVMRSQEGGGLLPRSEREIGLGHVECPGWGCVHRHTSERCDEKGVDVGQTNRSNMKATQRRRWTALSDQIRSQSALPRHLPDEQHGYSMSGSAEQGLPHAETRERAHWPTKCELESLHDSKSSVGIHVEFRQRGRKQINSR